MAPAQAVDVSRAERALTVRAHASREEKAPDASRRQGAPPPAAGTPLGRRCAAAASHLPGVEFDSLEVGATPCPPQAQIQPTIKVQLSSGSAAHRGVLNGTPTL